MEIMKKQLSQIHSYDVFINQFLVEEKLLMAIKKGEAEKVKEILDENPTLLYRKSITLSPLHYACNYSNLEIVEMIIDSGINKLIDEIDEDGDTPLHYAVMHRNLDLVDLLVRRGANLDIQNINSETPILIALKDNNIEIFKYLLNSGAELCLRSKHFQAQITKHDN